MQLLRTKYHVLVFGWTFQQKVAKSGSFREKARKNIDLAKTLQLLNKLPCLCISMNFSGKSYKKGLISWKRTKNHRFGQNFATFRTNYHVFAFRWTFQEKVAKSASFREKARKTIDLAKTCIFWSKLPCFGIFMNFSARSCKKCLISWKSTRNHRFGQNYATFRTNYHVFAFRWTFKEKVGKSGSFREKARKIMDLVKTCNFLKTLPCFDVSMNFSAKSCKSASFREKARKIIDLAKTLQLFEQTTMSLHFDELFRKKLQKVRHFVKKHEKPSIWPKLASFGANYHVLAFSWTFQQEVAKSASFREKAREIIDLAKTMQLFEQTTMFLHFDELLRKRLGKVVHFVKKHEKSWIWSKLATFWKHYHVLTFRWTFQQKVAKTASFHEKARKLIDLAKTMQLLRTKYHVLVFRWTFQEKVAKSGSFREKARKTIDLAKTCIFWSKLPCFGIFMNFSARSCKKCLISWKSTRNHRFGQNYATFRTNYHVFAFRWTFKEKVGKSGSFREKARKIMDLVKTCNFLKTLPCFDVSMNFSAKGCKKWLNSWKSTKNHRFGQNFATFRTNYHVFAFRWTFQEKVAKSASFREKARKTIDLAKTCIFWSKLPCFGIFMNFSARSCKKCLISWKSTRNHRFGQNYATFWTNYHVFAFRWTFKEKVGKSGSFREKARKIMDLVKTCNFLKTLPCFDVSMNFSAKSCKNRLISCTKTHRFGQNYATSSNKVRKIIDLAKTLQLFEQTTMSLHFDELFRKKLQKVRHFVKKHEKPSIWPKLASFGANYHVLAFSWTFQQEVAKSASFREKAREIIDLAKTMQLFEQTTMFLHFDELLRKRLGKVVHFVKKHEKSWIWSKLATFWKHYHVLTFRWTFQQKVAKTASFH